MTEAAPLTPELAKLARTPDRLAIYRYQLVPIIIMLVGWWIIFASIITATFLDEDAIVWAWLGIGVGIVIIIATWIIYLLRKPVVIIDAEGYRDRRLGISLISWQDVQYVSFGVRGKRKIIRFIFEDIQPYLDAYEQPPRYRGKQQTSLHENEMTVTFDRMNHSTEDILAVIRKVSGKTGRFEGKFGVHI